MYPSVTFSMVKRSFKSYSIKIKKRDKETIKHCFEMIKVGMGNTLITFIDKYYEYS